MADPAAGNGAAVHVCSVCGTRHRSWLGLDGCRARHRYVVRPRVPRPAAPAPRVEPRRPPAAESVPATPAAVR